MLGTLEGACLERGRGRSDDALHGPEPEGYRLRVAISRQDYDYSSGRIR